MNRNFWTAVCNLIFFSAVTASAQTNFHLVYFTDKNNSPFSVEKPSEFLSTKAQLRRAKQQIEITPNDFPVNPFYLDSLNNLGLTVHYSSKWLNAALVEATALQIQQIVKFNFVKGELNLEKQIAKGTEFSTINSVQQAMESQPNYGNSRTQISMPEIDKMHLENLMGQGITIAVLDAGFNGVNQFYGFDSLNLNHRLKSTYDFPDRETDVYDDHNHGTSVLSLMAGYLSGQLIGAAWKADYILLRTEVAGFEKQLEEVYWLLGAEYADSAGADIISSSLGYSTFPDDPLSHVYADLNGKTSIATLAAEKAFSKGILVVNSAGNEGETGWKYVNVPADGEHVLTVGGVNKDRSYYVVSSQGPTSDGRIKPDVVTLGNEVTVFSSGGVIPGHGTSFAAPVVAAFAANLWQKFPDLTNNELLELIKKSSSRADQPDNLVGYGIPSYSRALFINGFKDAYAISSVSISPNPCRGKFEINSMEKTPMQVKIVSVSGQEVYILSRVQTDLRSVDISGLPAGLYFVIITTDQRSDIFHLVNEGRD